MSALFQLRGQLRGGLGNPKAVVTPPHVIVTSMGVWGTNGVTLRGEGYGMHPPAGEAMFLRLCRCKMTGGLRCSSFGPKFPRRCFGPPLGPNTTPRGAAPRPGLRGPGLVNVKAPVAGVGAEVARGQGGWAFDRDTRVHYRPIWGRG